MLGGRDMIFKAAWKRGRAGCAGSRYETQGCSIQAGLSSKMPDDCIAHRTTQARAYVLDIPKSMTAHGAYVCI